MFNLKHFIHDLKPDFIFLSEPQLFTCDLDRVMSHFKGEYFYSLNAPDSHEPDLPLRSSKATGGTMLMWKSDIHPYVTIRSASTSSFLPLIFQPPGTITSVHISVYLPTHGREQDFILDLSKLASAIDQLKTEFPASPLYIRGDFNVGKNHLRRQELLSNFIEDMNLVEISNPIIPTIILLAMERVILS